MTMIMIERQIGLCLGSLMSFGVFASAQTHARRDDGVTDKFDAFGFECLFDAL